MRKLQWKDVDFIQPNDGQECLVKHPIGTSKRERDVFVYDVLTYWIPDENSRKVWQDVESEEMYFTWNWPYWVGIDEIESSIFIDSIEKLDNAEDKQEEKKLAFDGKSEHYCAGGMEAIDVIEAYGLGFSLGNAVKYILRCGHKGGGDDAIRDLEKARAYIDREITRRKRTSDLEGLAKREAQG